MTHFQTYRPSLDEILDGTDLTPAEEKLLAACKTDGAVSFGYEVPKEATPENSIRGELIRYLMMGGCDEHRPNAQGVAIFGGFIKRTVNLQGCRSPLDLMIAQSRFVQKPNFNDCEVGALILSGSRLPGMTGQRMCVKRNLFLKDGFHSSASIMMTGAQIGGQLACDGGVFESDEGPALKVHGISVSGSVFLRSGFHARGLVDLTGAQFGGQFSCDGGVFEPEEGPALIADGLSASGDVFLQDGFQAHGLVDLTGAKIGGQLSCRGGVFKPAHGSALEGHRLSVSDSMFLRDGFHAHGLVDLIGTQIAGQLVCVDGRFEQGINLQSAKVGAEFYFRSVKQFDGTLDLNEAQVACLADDLESWNKPNALDLTGFRYDALQSEMSVESRLSVLAKHADQEDGPVFHSQPYTHLAGYYQKSGQRQAGAQVLYERDKQQAKADLEQAYANTDGTWKTEWPRFAADFLYVFRRAFDLFAGFGHKPMRAFYWALGTILFSMLYFHLTYINGQMVPNSDIILNSQAWLSVVDDGVPNPAEAWGLTDPGRDYETFSALGYGFDLFVPLDALGQEVAWAPSYSRGWWGSFGHYLRWPIQIMGWVLTAIGAALLTGLIGRDRE